MLRSRIGYAHNAFVLNEHIATDGSFIESLASDTFVVDRREYEAAFRDGRDPYHLAQGGSLGSVHKGLGYLRLHGRLLVPDATRFARMSDRERALRAAFDPALCALDSPTTEGAYALTWDEPTADTATYPSGFIPVQSYMRPSAAPAIRESVDDLSSRAFTIGLIAADPRIYSQSESTLVLTPASPVGDVVNRGNVPAPLKMTLVMSGAGSSTFRIFRGVFFDMNLSGTVNGDTIVVVFETSAPFGRGKYITKNGVENFALKTSGPDTWLLAGVGTFPFTIVNHTNVASCTLAWRSAWA